MIMDTINVDIKFKGNYNEYEIQQILNEIVRFSLVNDLVELYKIRNIFKTDENIKPIE